MKMKKFTAYIQNTESQECFQQEVEAPSMLEAQRQADAWCEQNGAEAYHFREINDLVETGPLTREQEEQRLRRQIDALMD